MNRALKTIGYERRQTGHRFRAVTSTIMNEQNGFGPGAIEQRLGAHAPSGVRHAYSHAMYLAKQLEKAS